MGIDIDKSATEIASKLDAGGKREEVDQAMQKCFTEIMAENPANAKTVRQEFIEAINRKEKDGVGDDLTIKTDGSGIKHFTIMSARLNEHAQSVATKLENKDPIGASLEISDVHQEIAKNEPDPAKQKQELQQFLLTTDAYEQKRDSVKVEYDRDTNQPTKAAIDYNFAPQDARVAPGDVRGAQIAKSRQEIAERTAVLATEGDPKVARDELTNLLLTTADLLTQADPTKPIAQLQEQRTEADKMFSDALQLQEANEAPAPLLADIARQQGLNRIYLASSCDFNTPEGLKAYRAIMESAIDILNQGNTALDEKTNDHIPFKVAILGNLGLAELGRANAKDDRNAQNSEKAFRDALVAYKKYQAPDEDAQKQIDVVMYNNVLRNDRYPKILAARGHADEEAVTLKAALQKKYGFKVQ